MHARGQQAGIHGTTPVTKEWCAAACLCSVEAFNQNLRVPWSASCCTIVWSSESSGIVGCR